MIFSEHNGFVVDLTGQALHDAVLALLAAALADKTPFSDQHTFSWLKLQLDYQNQLKPVRDLLDISREPLLLTFKQKFKEGYFAHLVFVMFWAIKSNGVKEAGLSKAYYLTETLLTKKYGISISQKTIKKYYKEHEHVVHIWVAIFSYSSLRISAQQLYTKSTSFQQQRTINVLFSRLMKPRFLVDAASFYFYGTDAELPRSSTKTRKLYLVDRKLARPIVGVNMIDPPKLEVSDEFKQFCADYVHIERY